MNSLGYQSLIQHLGDVLNLEQVGVVGQSFGGYTALALAGTKINFEQLKADCPALENTLNVSLYFNVWRSIYQIFNTTYLILG